MHRYHKLITILNNWLRRQLNHMTNYLGEVQIRFYLIARLFVLVAQSFAGSNKSEYFQQIQLKMLHNSRPDRRMHHHPRPPPFYCLFIDFYTTLKVTEPAGTFSLERCFHCASVWRSMCKCQVMKSECANHGSHPWRKYHWENFLLTFWAQRGVHYRENGDFYSHFDRSRGIISRIVWRPETRVKNPTIWLWVERDMVAKNRTRRKTRNQVNGNMPKLLSTSSSCPDSLIRWADPTTICSIAAFFESLPVSFHCCACRWWWWSKTQQLPQLTCRFVFFSAIFAAWKEIFPLSEK